MSELVLLAPLWLLASLAHAQLGPAAPAEEPAPSQAEQASEVSADDAPTAPAAQPSAPPPSAQPDPTQPDPGQKSALLTAPVSTPSQVTALAALEVRPPSVSAARLSDAETATFFSKEADARRFVAYLLTLRWPKGTPAGSTVRVSRTSVRGRVGMRSVAPLDGAQLRGFARVDGTAPTVAFGLVGALAVADSQAEREKRADAAAWEERVLSEARPEQHALVFFEQGNTELAVESIELTAQVAPSGERYNIVVQLGSSPPYHLSRAAGVPPARSPAVPALRWGGAGLAMTGLGLIVVSYAAFEGSHRSSDRYDQMRPVNDAGWVLFGVGTAMHLLSWVVTPKQRDKGRTELSLTPSGLAARGRF